MKKFTNSELNIFQTLIQEKINFINNSYEIEYLKTYKEQLQELYLKILESYNYGEDE
jgi:hypothetical protein